MGYMEDKRVRDLFQERQLKRRLVEQRLREKEKAEKKLSPSTVSLINKAKYLLILYVVAKVLWTVLRSFLARVEKSRKS